MNRPLGRAPFTVLAFAAIALTAGVMSGGAVRLEPIPDPGPMPAQLPPSQPTVKRRSKAERRARNAKRWGKGK